MDDKEVNDKAIVELEKCEDDSIFKATRFLMFVCLLFLFGSVALILIMPNIGEYVAQYVLIGLPVYFFVSKREKWPFKDTFRFNKLKFRDILILIALTISIQPFLNFMLLISKILFGDAMGTLFDTVPSEPFFVLVLSMVVAPTICEELIMRGVVLNASRGLTLGKAVLLNGVLFGFFHMNFNQFSYTIFMGMILAYVVLITNSIFAGMVIHFLNNLWAIVSYKWPENTLVKLQESFLVEILNPIGLLTIAISVITIIVLLKLLKKSNPENDYKPDTKKQSDRVLEWPFWIITGLFILNSVLIMLSANIAEKLG